MVTYNVFQVWLARYHDRLVAVKKLKPVISMMDESMTEDFWREIR